MEIETFKGAVTQLHARVQSAAAELRTMCADTAEVSAPAVFVVGMRVRVADDSCDMFGRVGAISAVSEHGQVCVAFANAVTGAFRCAQLEEAAARGRGKLHREAAEAAAACDVAAASFRSCFMEVREKLEVATHAVAIAKRQRQAFEKDQACERRGLNMEGSWLVKLWICAEDVFEAMCERHMTRLDVAMMKQACSALRDAGSGIKSVVLTDAGDRNQPAALLVLHPSYGVRGTVMLYGQKCSRLSLIHI